MIQSNQFLKLCKDAGISLFTGTPCSYLKPFINTVIDANDLEFIETTNEGDAVALASGAWAGGRKSLVMFQNSGLGNAVNPITSLSYTMKIPFMGIVTLRGEVGGPADEPQHELMGAITTEMLDTMKVSWAYFPVVESEVEDSFKMALEKMEKEQRPFFFVMRKNSVEAYDLKSSEPIKTEYSEQASIQKLGNNNYSITRTEALKVIKEKFNNSAPMIATTGKTGRELFELGDTANQAYMVGSMGCALPMGIGLTQTDCKEKVVVIDGDGALMMRMGNMALAGQVQPENLVHILLDNGVHDSTGGQRSFSERIDFSKVAQGCGYGAIYEMDNLDDFSKVLDDCIASNKLTFVRLFTKPGSPKDLGRPTVKPYEVAARFREYVIGKK